MKAIILAAGEGVRMRPLTLERPKPLVEVLGKPILTHIFEALPEAITELIVVIGYRGEQIQEYYGSHYNGKPVTYVAQSERGTLGALRSCRDILPEDEKFLVMNGDDLHGPDGIRACVEGDAYALMVAQVPHPEKFGVVEVDEAGRIVSIEEKPELPKTNLVSTGLWVLDASVFRYPVEPQKNGEYYLTDPTMAMISEGRDIYAIKTSAWFPIGYPEDIARAEDVLRRSLRIKNEAAIRSHIQAWS